MRIKHIVAAALGLMLSATVFAHGLMESPASRNWICGAVTKPDQVANGNAQTPICGEAFAVNSIAGYSFMSVLTHNLGRASVTPLPANVCSFDSETWKGAVTPWDMPIDWPTNPMTSGEQDITWNISWGPHFDDTAEFRYWITKSTFQFSKTKALTWDDFESTPFCVLNYEDSTPTANPNVTADKAAQKFHTKCTVPARSGHHVIYGEWGRKPPTLERFHGCIDGAFGGVVNPETVVAQIAATPANLNVTGAGTITFSGAASQGTNLTYLWAVESANTSLYTLSSTNTTSTTLTLKNPQALTTFTVRLTVSNGSSSNSTSMTFNHSPSVASNWQDFGALTTTARTMSVGDKVSVRMVNGDGVDTYFPALTITSATAGEAAWTYALAQQINAANGDVQVGVLNSSDNVVAAQSATTNRIYAKAPSTYVSAFLQVAGAVSSSSSSTSTSKTSSSVSSSSVSSSVSGQQCNWYGTLYPLCVTTASGWGWENNRNCIAASTCTAQPAPYGIVGTASSVSTSVATSKSSSTSSSVSSSVVSTSRSSSSTSTSVATSTSSSVKTSSSSSVKTSSSSSSLATSSSSSAGTGGNCSYVVTNQWSNGFTAAIRIKNNGTTAINGWTVNWSYTDGSLVTNGWSATVTGSNPYSATNLSWNAAIQPGQSVELGIQGTKTAASASVPVVTGAACN